MSDGDRIWLQVEDKRSPLESPSVLYEQDICLTKDVFGIYRKPSAILDIEPLYEIEVVLNDGSSKSLGNFSSAKVLDVERYLGQENLLEFGKIPTKAEVSFFGSTSLDEDAKGVVRFALSTTKLLVSFGESAELGSSGFELGPTGKFVKVIPIEKSMTFAIDEFDGVLSTEVQKRARVGATIALFPIVGLASILVPAKKVSVTTDTRTYEIRMAGKGWQLLFVVPLSHLGYILRLRESIANSILGKKKR
jgi:hypothetical protein